jgi:Rrf2 family nitric oxide-sensitive transcriptional repressor
MKKTSLLTREQDYSLRIAAFLASLKKDEFISVSKISKKLLIPKHFTSRILHKLKKAEITDAYKGKYGGVYLKINPKYNSLWDILKAIGFKARLNECLDDNFVCELMFGCKFRSFFIEQEKFLIDKLKSQKISDFKFKNLN